MKLVIIWVLLGVGFTSLGQNTLSGRVADLKKIPLKGASVSIKGSYDGATTDSLGLFSFTTSETGSQVLEVSFQGYKSAELRIEIKTDMRGLEFYLKENITELKAVVLTAGTFEASDQKKSTVLNSIDIVTTASANADITTAIKTLPGTQQVGETEGLFVRGGTAGESKTFIDGTLVNNFFYSSQPGLAQRGRFNPFLFKGTTFSAGGYSALYGQALSSVLILESIDLPQTSSGDLAFSYLGVGGGLQKLAKDKNSSWGLSYNYTDLRLAYKLVKQTPDYFHIPVLHNLDGNFRVKTSDGIIKYYGTASSTRVGFRYADLDSLGMKNAFSLKNLNTYHNLSWKERLQKGYRLFVAGSYSNNKDDISNEWQDSLHYKQSIPSDPLLANKNFDVELNGHYVNAKWVLEKKLMGLNAVRAGSEYNYSKENSIYTRFDSARFNQLLTENLLSFFAEADFYISNNLAAKTGLRAEHSSLLDKWNLAPRFSLAYKLKDNSQFSFAYGMFFQNPDRQYLRTNTELNFSESQHYILQYQKMSNARTLRLEAYYKNYNELIKTKKIQGTEQAAGNGGSGYAKGIEVFWRDKKTIRNLDYWVSYTFLDTERDFLNYPGRMEPSFAAKHTASLVIKKFATKLKTLFNGSYTFSSGRPYYHILTGINGENKISDMGRVKDFHSMSFSMNYLPKIAKQGAGKFTVFVFSITNILGTDNIFTYNYSYDGKVKQAVRPPARRFYYLGCFLSFGIDRTQDAINNNL